MLKLTIDKKHDEIVKQFHINNNKIIPNLKK